MGSSTFPTLEWSSILLWLSEIFFHHSGWLLLNLGWLLLLILEVRRFETSLPLTRLLIHLVIPCILVVRFFLAFLIEILSFSYRLFQSSRFRELNLVFVGLRQSTQKALDFYLLIFNIPNIPQQFQEIVCIFLHRLLSQSQLMEFFDFIIIVLVREVLLLEIFLELFPDNIPFIYLL